jgi:hypothetical protein
LLAPAFFCQGSGSVTVGTVTATDVTGVVTVADVGVVTGAAGTAGTEGTAGADGNDVATPLTVSAGDVEIVEMTDDSPAGCTDSADSEEALPEGWSSVGALLSAPCPGTPREGRRKAEVSTEPRRATTAGHSSTLGANARA